jgi:hypothetical protein
MEKALRDFGYSHEGMMRLYGNPDILSIVAGDELISIVPVGLLAYAPRPLVESVY